MKSISRCLLLVLAASWAMTAQAVDPAALHGTWTGKLGGDHEQTLVLSDDGAYLSSVSIMGMEMVEQGHWRLDGDQLHFDSQLEQRMGTERPGRGPYARQVKSLDGDHLVIEHDDAVGNRLRSDYRRQ